MGGASSTTSASVASSAAKPAMSSQALATRPAMSSQKANPMPQPRQASATANNKSPVGPGKASSADQQQKDSWRETLGKTVQDASSQIAQAFANQQAVAFSPVIASSPVLDEAANISAPAFPGPTRFASDLVRNQALNEAMTQTGRLAGAGSQGYRF